jgi:hypothetical protein
VEAASDTGATTSISYEEANDTSLNSAVVVKRNTTASAAAEESKDRCQVLYLAHQWRRFPVTAARTRKPLLGVTTPSRNANPSARRAIPSVHLSLQPFVCDDIIIYISPALCRLSIKTSIDRREINGRCTRIDRSGAQLCRHLIQFVFTEYGSIIYCLGLWFLYQ